MDNTDLVRRVLEFANRNGLTLGNKLGAGVQGIVFNAKSQVDQGRLAIKVHDKEPGYLRERNTYFRLQALGITKLRGCHVPELIACDDELWIIAMTVVTRPFVLDFGGAYLDSAPELSEEILAEWRADKQELFETRWPEVQAIMRELQTYGIFLLDVNPGNISITE